MLEIQTAVDSYCSRHDCKPAPTMAQVAKALVSYCVTGTCQGEDGQDGQQGEQGIEGKQGPPGERGPGPTPEQIQEAVVNYCSTGACAGTTSLTLSGCQQETGMVIVGIEPSGNPKDGYVLTCTKAVDLVTPGNGQQP